MTGVGRFGVAIAVVACAALFNGQVWAANAAAQDGFCAGKTIHDYGRMLEAMPGKRVPASGHLPFGPEFLSFDTPNQSVLVPSGQAPLTLTYGLSAPSGEYPASSVAWQLTGSLMEVNSKGKVKRTVGVRRKKVNLMGGRAFNGVDYSFEVPSRAAFYGVATEFRAQDGKVLGKYAQYFRVVKPTVRTALAVERSSLRIGEALEFRVKNFGTASVSFGEMFSIEKFAEGTWSPFPMNIRPSRQKRASLGAGEAGACQSLVVSSEMSPGRYRVRKDLLRGPHSLTAEFEVKS